MKKSLQKLTKQKKPREIFEQIINKSLPRGTKQPIKNSRNNDFDVFTSPLKKKRELIFAQKIKRDGREKSPAAAVYNEPIKINYYDDCILNIPWISLGPTVTRSNLSLQDIDLDDERKKLHSNDIRNKGKLKHQQQKKGVRKKHGDAVGNQPEQLNLEVIEDTNYQFLRSGSKKKRCKFYSSSKTVKSNNNNNVKRKTRKVSRADRKSSDGSDYDGVLPKLVFDVKSGDDDAEGGNLKGETQSRKRFSSFCLPSIVISNDSCEEGEEAEEENNGEGEYGKKRTFSLPHGCFSRSSRKRSTVTLFPHAHLSTVSTVLGETANNIGTKDINNNASFPAIPKMYDSKGMSSKQKPIVTASVDYKQVLTSIGT